MENIYVCQRCFHKFNKNNGYNFINGRGPYCDSCYTFLGGKKSGTPLIVDLIKTGKSLGLRRIGLLLLPFSLGFYTLNLIVFIATIIIESFFIKRIYYKAYFSGTRLVHNKIQIKESTKKTNAFLEALKNSELSNFQKNIFRVFISKVAG